MQTIADAPFGAGESPILLAPHCDLVALQLSAGGEVPKHKWIQVATAGDYRGHHQGEFALNRGVFDSFVRNFRNDPRYEIGLIEVDGRTITAGTKPVVRFDFEHTSEGNPNQGRIPIDGLPAPAWALDLEIRDGNQGPELWALAKLGDKIRGYIANDEYRQTSIAFTLNGVDYRTKENVGPLITSIAFTNDPFLKHLESFAASRRASLPPPNTVKQSKSTGDGATGNDSQPGDPPMGADSKNDHQDELNQLRTFRLGVCNAIGVRTLATDNEIIEAVEGQAAAVPAMSGMLDSLGVSDLEAAKGTIANLQAAMAELDKLRAEIAGILQANAAADAEVAAQDVAAVMSANSWKSDALKPALLARRAQLVTEHIDAAKKKDDVKTLSAGRVVTVTEEARQAFLRENGIKPAAEGGGTVDPQVLTASLVAARGGVQLAANTGKPVHIVQRSQSSEISLANCKGANLTYKVIDYLSQNEDGFKQLSWQQQCSRAATFKAEHPELREQA